GDLKFGRTVHSLIAAFARYTGIKFVLISPKELCIPEYVKTETLDKKGIPYKEVRTLEEAMPELDILYMTRIQRERFADPAEYERLKNSFVLDLPKLETAKADLCIMHPLPRVNEISTKVDNDPRACYFDQALCGKFIRMALILKLLAETPMPCSVCEEDEHKEELVNQVFCDNPRCITSIEQEINHVFRYTDKENGICRCAYCEAQKKI
ncbi:MAG: aspartate carbamoyltransferase, partial [Oscillospiraceae bacterium]|nr:aspartate carbamoyltransferase [Oscillospiraceae bacterium]